jgi:hypothetical protein
VSEERLAPGEPASWRADQRAPETDEQARGLAGAAEIRALLTRARVVAMVGLSADEIRPSYFVAVYLKHAGYRIWPVNPRYAGTSILGRPVVASLAEIPEHVDIVDVFRRPSDAPAVVREAIAIGADAVWLQLTVINAEAANLAREAGLTVVMDRCIKVEHGRHLGKMRTFGLSTGIISSRKPPARLT